MDSTSPNPARIVGVPIDASVALFDVLALVERFLPMPTPKATPTGTVHGRDAPVAGTVHGRNAPVAGTVHGRDARGSGDGSRSSAPGGSSP